MKPSVILFSLLFASQALPVVIQSAAAQSSAQLIQEQRAESDDHFDPLQIQLYYQKALSKLKHGTVPAYSYDEVTETTKTLADGNQVKTQARKSYYRDQQGRMRITYKKTVGGADRIFIADPTTQTAYLVRPERKDVLRMTGAALEPAPNAAATPPVLPDYYKNSVRTDLGQKDIAGVQARGSMLEVTVPAGTDGNDKDMVRTNEMWFATQLGEPVYLRRFSQRFGENLMHIENLKLGDVAALAVELPSDYAVRDVTIAPSVAQQ